MGRRQDGGGWAVWLLKAGGSRAVSGWDAGAPCPCPCARSSEDSCKGFPFPGLPWGSCECHRGTAGPLTPPGQAERLVAVQTWLPEPGRPQYPAHARSVQGTALFWGAGGMGQLGTSTARLRGLARTAGVWRGVRSTPWDVLER